MSRPIKFRAWDGDKMHQDVTYSKDYTEGVKPWIFMQFTGLHDKFGREIYEGDVVKAPHDFGPGGFHDRSFSVQWDNRRGYQWNYWLMDKAEVIGNIHEFPDLLK